MRVLYDVSIVYTYIVVFAVLSTHSNKVGGQEKQGLNPTTKELSRHSRFRTKVGVASKSQVLSPISLPCPPCPPTFYITLRYSILY